MNDAVAYIITAVLGGGIFKGIEAVYRAVTETREKRVLAEVVGAKTPTEIESVAVTTMTSALESAQSRIQSLEGERRLDQEHYLGRIALLEAEKLTDREYYQSRILELTNQIHSMREQLETVERTLANLLQESHQIDEEERS